LKKKRESISLDKPIEKPKIARVLQLTGIRKTVAERLSYSHRTIPTATLMLEVDMERLLAFRDELSKKTGQKVSFTAFLGKAVAKALRNNLILNSSVEDDKVNVYEDINISIAIDTPKGLMAPAIFNVDKKSIPKISDEIERLVENASRGELAIAELVGGTFTVTNLGAFGIEAFIPLVNPPQTAIIGVGKTYMKPVAVGDKIVVKPLVTISLVFDHRVVDGAPAAAFLQEVKRFLENPHLLEE